MYEFETYFKTFLKKLNTIQLTWIHLNVLDHSTNAKVQDYLNLAFQNFFYTCH